MILRFFVPAIMKKYTTIIALLLSVAALKAQYIDKDNLPGRWSVYSMRIDAIYLCRDSMEQTKESFFKLMKKGMKDKKISKEEMAQFEEEMERLLAGLDQSYLQFNKDGTGKAYFALDEEDNEDWERTYKWASDKDLVLMRNGEPYSTLRVISLTKTQLVVTKVEGEGSEVPNQVVFRKR